MAERPFSPEIKKPSETPDDHLAFWTTWYTDQWANLIADGFTPQDIAHAWQIDIGDGSDEGITKALEKKAQEKVASLAPAEESADVESAWVKNISDEWDALIDQDMEPREIAAMMGMDADLFIGEDGIVDEELKEEAFRYEAGKRMREEEMFEQSLVSSSEAVNIESRKVASVFLPKGKGRVRVREHGRTAEYQGASRTAWVKELLAEMGWSFVFVESTEATTDVLYIPSERKAVAVDDTPHKATYVVYDIDEDSFSKWLSTHRINAHEMAYDTDCNQFQIIQWRGDRQSWKKSVRDALAGPVVKRARRIKQKTYTPLFRENKPIPDGWMRELLLAEELGVAWITLSEFFIPIREQHPSWFSKAGGKQRDVAILSPEAIKLARSRYRDQQKYKQLTKDGWVMSESLLNTLVSRANLSALIKQYKPIHPEWFQTLIIKGVERHLYHPSFVTWLHENVVRKNEWVSTSDLAKEFGVSYDVITRMVKNVRADHPEWLILPSVEGVMPRKMFHPAIIEYVREVLQSRVPPQPNWKTVSQVKLALGVADPSPQWFIDEVNYQRQIHPEWFEQAWIQHDFYEQLSPELIKHLQAVNADRYGEKKVAPKPGWKPLRGVMAMINKGQGIKKWVREAIDQQRPIHPEWFEKAWGGTGYFDYYSPELIVHLLAIKAERDLAKRKD